MVYSRQLFMICICLAALASVQPIMVTFGTNQGPIVPRLRHPKSTSAQERTTVIRNPAPVSEEREDIPNPNEYRAPIPHQYRTKLYSFKPSANLILGTPLDIKYTPHLQKYSYPKKQRSFNLGLDYTGPHIFEKQEYEALNERKTTLLPSVSYNKPYNHHQINRRNDKYVPQIGIIYSSGIRYYIPQIIYIDQEQKIRDPKEENSVYDVDEEKFYH